MRLQSINQIPEITLGDTTSEEEEQRPVNKTISFTPKHSQSQALAIISPKKQSLSTSKKRRPTQSQENKFEKRRQTSSVHKSLNFHPRAKSPDVDPNFEPETSCSEQDLSDTDAHEELRRKRKLKLKEIIGSVKDGKEILLVVKWHGIADLEKVPLSVLRRFHSQEIIDYLLDKIKWAPPLG